MLLGSHPKRKDLEQVVIGHGTYEACCRHREYRKQFGWFNLAVLPARRRQRLLTMQ